MNTFFIFGNSTWKGFPQRDIHFAAVLAKKGFDVFFIEAPSSFAQIIKSKINSNNEKNNVEFYNSKDINNLTVITPPVLPTFFRSSITPEIDKRIIKKWFAREIKPFIQPQSFFYAFSPLWYFFLEDFLFLFDKKLYDIFDDIKISTRNERARRYNLKWEKIMVDCSDAVTCSAEEIREYIEYSYDKKSLLIRNGIVDSFNRNLSRKYNSLKKIGLIAALTVLPECYDLELIELIAENFEEFDIEIIGPYFTSHKEKFAKYKNIKLLGPLFNEKLTEKLNDFDVCIIPFLNNEIVKTINPLKLYEYLSFGKPVIATDNFDYEDAADFIYIADGKEAFIENIEKALQENNDELRSSRIKYAETKTWNDRLLPLMELLNLT